jgi:polyisoprenoid-binding protein YceI
MMKSSLLAAVLAFALAAGAAPQSPAPIDAERSTLTVHVFKAGLFSAFAHDHQIRAPIGSGWVDEAGSGAVELRVDARRMQVLDPSLPADKRAEVQETMHSAKVLESERYPDIIFVSRVVEPAGENAYRVLGDLTLHGVTRAVTVNVIRQQGRYTGSATLKQTDFGIKPVSLAGGTIKVKDIVRIEFDIAIQ